MKCSYKLYLFKFMAYLVFASVYLAILLINHEINLRFGKQSVLNCP